MNNIWAEDLRNISQNRKTHEKLLNVINHDGNKN